MNKELLKELFRKKARLKEIRDSYWKWFFIEAIFPWLGTIAISLIWLIKSQTIIKPELMLALAIGTIIWGTYWRFKIRKVSRKIALIDK